MIYYHNPLNGFWRNIMQKKQEKTNYMRATTESLGNTYAMFHPVPDMTGFGKLLGEGLDYIGDGIEAAVEYVAASGTKDTSNGKKLNAKASNKRASTSYSSETISP